jgi:hypothetical protein
MIPDWNWLPQPIVLSHSVEIFKAAVSSIKLKIMSEGAHDNLKKVKTIYRFINLYLIGL